VKALPNEKNKKTTKQTTKQKNRQTLRTEQPKAAFETMLFSHSTYINIGE